MLGWRRNPSSKTVDAIDPSSLSSRAAWRMLTRRRRTVILLIETLLIVAVALIGHITGREMARRHLVQRDQTIQQLREERQEVSAELHRRAERILTLETRLKHVEGVLHEIVPDQGIYVIRPNQSLVVAGGRVVVGLVDSPANRGININVNGKQQFAAAGDVITTMTGAGPTCYVTVQSFDMFKAVLQATCAADAVKPQ
jgi:hypothetical protein